MVRLRTEQQSGIFHSFRFGMRAPKGQTGHRTTGYLERIHEFLFSAYFSLLFAWAEETRPFRGSIQGRYSIPWSMQGRFIRFWHPHAVALGPTDFLMFYLELFLVPAAVMFLCLVVIRRFSLTRFLLRPLGGLLAVVGLPLVNLYHLDRRLVLLEFALALSVICFVLWACQKWPLSTPVSIFLLIVYYVVCSLFGGGPGSFNWGWAHGIWEYLWLVYPVLGFCYTLVWAAYFRQSETGKSNRTLTSTL